MLNLKETFDATLAIDSFPLSCKLNELESIIKSVEEKDGFHKWLKPPLEQLDEVIGKLTNPDNDVIPPIMLFYVAKVKMLNNITDNK